MNPLITLAAGLLASVFSTDNERTIEYSQLPQKAQQFIEAHFKGSEVLFVNKESGLTYTEYKVHMRNGNEIEFSGRGEWEEIDCEHRGVPESVIPAKIASFLKERHPDLKVEKISRDRNKIEIDTDKGIEIVFNSDFELLRYDD